jgi:ABC-type Fe3+ transport system substrate-binding protein
VLGVLAVLGCAAGCRKKARADLVVISPHNPNIQREFEQAFRAWHKAEHGSGVTFEWREVGGTTSITRFLINQYEGSDTSGIDVYFGGGGPDHRKLTRKGITVPVKLPDEIMRQIPADIRGVPQHDPDGRWHAAAVSCFGILYNAKLLAAKGLPVPKTWDDLADPRMYGQISAADASQSGSAKAAYEMIVQSAPDWPQGWAKLLKIFGNCRRFTGGASDVISDVADGDVLAGAAIDFYAYNQMAASEPGELGFALPPETAAFTPDPISLLKGAPHEPMASKFIEFVLSEQAQALWCLEAGTPNGPKTHTLRRQPIRRDLYETYKGKMVKPLVNVYEVDFELDRQAHDVRVANLYSRLMKAAVLDSREQLARAWKVILDAGDTPKARQLTDQFVALPPNLTDRETALATARRLSGDKKKAQEIVNRWQQFWRDKYNSIIRQQ